MITRYAKRAALGSGYKLLKQSAIRITVALSALGMAGVANASLVGDTVTVGHHAPDTTTSLPGVNPPTLFTVAAGTSDIYTFYDSYPFGYQVNVEAASILVDFSYLHEATATWADSVTLTTFEPVPPCGIYGCAYISIETVVPYSFNGLIVSDLNDSSGGALQGVTVDTNMDGWSSDRLSFGSDHVQFDWKGLSFTSNFYNADGSLITPATYFNATLDFGGAAVTTPVPEPESYAMLMAGLGLLGAVARRRKKKAA